MSRTKAKRIEIKDGNIVVPIYEYSDGRFCVDTMMGETRRRVTRTSLDAAKLEARMLIAQIRSGRNEVAPLTISESEDYRLAKQKIEPFKVSLLTVVEEWIAGRGKTTEFVVKNVPEIIGEFLVAKEVEGVGRFHLEDRKSRLNKFAESFTGRIDRVTSHEVEVWLKELQVSGRTRNNYRNAVLQLFRYARSKRYLPRNEPTAVDDVASVATSNGDIEIYSPTEIRLLLAHAPEKLLAFIAIGAFSGLRSQEIMRLEWTDIRFEQDFIEVSAAKAKTASRRLVPILPVLRDWLLPLRKQAGRVAGYSRNDQLSEARTRFCKSGIKDGSGKVIQFTWKPNALRHSFASYRLAITKSAAQVALEMGNSPSMLFRNYRELVTETEARDWFSVDRKSILISAS